MEQGRQTPLLIILYIILLCGVIINGIKLLLLMLYLLSLHLRQYCTISLSTILIVFTVYCLSYNFEFNGSCIGFHFHLYSYFHFIYFQVCLFFNFSLFICTYFCPLYCIFNVFGIIIKKNSNTPQPGSQPLVVTSPVGRGNIPTAVYFCLYVEKAGLQTGRCLEFQAHRQ